MKTILSPTVAMKRHAFCVFIRVLALLCLSKLPVLAQSTITTFVGGVNPSNGAQAITVSFARTESVTADGTGGFYFSTVEPLNSIYRVTADGTMTLVAGNGTAGFSGDGGLAVSAQLNSPAGIALDGGGNLLIADRNNVRIRRVTPAGIISTIAGTGTAGFSGDGGPATSAKINNPNGVAVDGNGNILFADSSNNRIRKISTDGTISTVAGREQEGFNGDNIPATSASLSYPSAVAFDAAGNLFIADRFNYRIRKVATNGTISTFAGNGSYGITGDGGLAVSARLAAPAGVATDGNGNVLIADTGSSRIRLVRPDGIIINVAGNGSAGFSGDSGLAVLGQLNQPYGVAADSTGGFLIADSDNQRIRKVKATIITTVAGNGTHGFGGDGGPAVSALLDMPSDIAFDAAGNLYIADTNNSRIRKVTVDGVISTLAGNGTRGNSGDGGLATSAALNLPGAIAVAADGTTYIADCNDRIRKVSPAGAISAFATNSWLFCSFDYYYYYYYDPISRGGVAVDATGNVFVADTFHYRVQRITPDGVISTVAGTGSFGFSGDGGPATAAQISQPWGIALDALGNLYIADRDNNRIRKVIPEGTISTVAGNGASGFSGDGGPATSAKLNYPYGVSADAAGNLFIADTSNNRVRRVNGAGIITTVAGNGTQGVGGDGGPPTNAQLNSPWRVAVDALGNLYIADTSNNRIRKVVFALTTPTLNGITSNFGGQGGPLTVTLDGTSFDSPLTIDAGSGITASDVTVQSETQATATFTIAANAPLGPHNVTATTSRGTSGAVTFRVVPPFPDLSISSSQTGNWEVGFNGTYSLAIGNQGTASTTGPIVVTDTLPTGLTLASGTGSGWSCGTSGQDVTCSNPVPLAPGASTTLTFTVAVDRNATSPVTHSTTVTVDGDLIASNNSASDSRDVIFPTLSFQFSSPSPSPASQGTVALNMSSVFAHDVTGKLTITFSPNAVVPADDPAIQFATGGRTVDFTISAGTTQARFASGTGAGTIAFQTGTVAGDFLFTATLQTGAVQTVFSNSRTLTRRPPMIHSARAESSTNEGLTVAVSLSSTTRDVTQLVLTFLTNPTVNLSCANVAGCSVLGNALMLDVKSLFQAWFTSDTQFGSLNTLRFPLTIRGKVAGSLQISLRNSVGISSGVSLALP